MKNKRKIYNVGVTPVCWNPYLCGGASEDCQAACAKLNSTGPTACELFKQKEEIRLGIINSIQNQCGVDKKWENNFMKLILEYEKADGVIAKNKDNQNKKKLAMNKKKLAMDKKSKQEKENTAFEKIKEALDKKKKCLGNINELEKNIKSLESKDDTIIANQRKHEANVVTFNKKCFGHHPEHKHDNHSGKPKNNPRAPNNNPKAKQNKNKKQKARIKKQKARINNQRKNNKNKRNK